MDFQLINPVFNFLLLSSNDLYIYLFAGSPRGAEYAAVIYFLIESCKMLNINTIDYFMGVLSRLPTTLNKEISGLFPCFWKPLINQTG